MQIISFIYITISSVVIRKMSEWKQRIHDEANGLDYVLLGDYHIPAIELPEDDDRLIGKWGRMHRVYLKKQTRFCSTT